MNSRIGNLNDLEGYFSPKIMQHCISDDHWTRMLTQGGRFLVKILESGELMILKRRFTKYFPEHYTFLGFQGMTVIYFVACSIGSIGLISNFEVL